VSEQIDHAEQLTPGQVLRISEMARELDTYAIIVKGGLILWIKAVGGRECAVQLTSESLEDLYADIGGLIAALAAQEATLKAIDAELAENLDDAEHDRRPVEDLFLPPAPFRSALEIPEWRNG
jgi:hypothetical protein